MEKEKLAIQFSDPVFIINFENLLPRRLLRYNQDKDNLVKDNTMKNKFDKNVISDFRRTVNGSNYFVMHHFSEYVTISDHEKKNLWSKICSCMDWIEVAISGLQEYPKFNINDINKGSLEFTQFILTIDMISEAIKNLWTTFSLAEDIKQYPLKSNKSIFEGTIWNKSVDDDVYFKHLRAFFGLHSVNGNEVQLPINGKKIKVRFFSSWSTSRDGKEFSLSMYSNNKDAEKKYGGQLKITVDKLISYAYKQYHTLVELSLEIENFHTKTLNDSVVKNQISLTDNLTPLEKMLALKEFSLQTVYLKEYYMQDIDWYIKILQVDQNIYTDKDRQLIQIFLKELEMKVIPAYKKALNSMTPEESRDIELISIDPKNIFKFHYDYSKVLVFCEYSSHDFSHDSYESAKLSKDFSLNMLIRNNELPEYANKLSKEELYLLIHAKAFHDSK